MDNDRHLINILDSLNNNNRKVLESLNKNFGVDKIHGNGTYELLIDKDWISDSFTTEKGLRLIMVEKTPEKICITKISKEEMYEMLNATEVDISQPDVLCPECESSDITKYTVIATRKDGKRQRYRCKECGRTFYNE